jgi:nifR3 family TIM-barrel protein
LREPQKIAEIVRAVRAATSLPLTIKIRSGWHCGDNSYLEIARIAEAEGCDAITLHPRSRSQMFSGHADWSQLTRLKECITIPVLGSGDLFSATDCMNMLRETGCDGVMIARGSLGAPWIFRQVTELAEHGSITPVTNLQRVDAIRQHLELFCNEVGEMVAVREMKKHIGWYARGFSGAADIRRSANSTRNIEDLHTLMERIAAIPDDIPAHT